MASKIFFACLIAASAVIVYPQPCAAFLGFQNSLQKVTALSSPRPRFYRPLSPTSSLPLRAVPITTATIAAMAETPSRIIASTVALQKGWMGLPFVAKGILEFLLLRTLVKTWVKMRTSKFRTSIPPWNEIDTASTLNVVATRTELEHIRDEKALDYIIVGSGLGGLTTASCLAKAGHRVLVLEAHHTAGGATHTFEEEGYSFAFGVHYVGAKLDDLHSRYRKLFDFVSDGALKWRRCAGDFDYAVNHLTGEKIPVNEDVATKMKTFATAFPDSASALLHYRRACAWAPVSSAILVLLKLIPVRLARLLSPILRPLYARFGERSAVEVMKKCGLKDDAIGALTYLYGDCGLPPGRIPFLIQSLLETHFDGGAFYPMGGPASIAKTIVAAIQRRGGSVLVGADVSTLLTRPLPDGRGHECYGALCKGVELTAKRGVISDAGFTNTFDRLLPPEVGNPFVDSLSSAGAFEPSFQLVYLFVGLDVADSELNLPSTNLWICNGWDHDAQWDKFEKAEAFKDVGSLPVVFLSFGSAKDGGSGSTNHRQHGNGKATLQLLAPVRMEWFKEWEDTKIHRRGKKYLAMKAEWRDRLLEYLYQYFPETKGHVAFTDVATPLTTNHYLHTLKGENYGLAQSINRFKLPTQLMLHTETTNVRGLYMVGQDQSFVGVVGVLGSGARVASFVSLRVALLLAAETLF